MKTKFNKNTTLQSKMHRLTKEVSTKSTQTGTAWSNKSLLVALQALKRKKRLEQQLDQLLSTMTTLETQRSTLENTHITAEVLETMKGANKALKKANKHMNIDDVQKEIDEISEMTDLSNEITEAISSLGPTFDDDELERELNDLKNETLTDKLLEIPSTIPSDIQLPSIPSEDPKRAMTKSKEDEFSDLLEWAN